jgi:hypothetical protein
MRLPSGRVNWPKWKSATPTPVHCRGCLCAVRRFHNYRNSFLAPVEGGDSRNSQRMARVVRAVLCRLTCMGVISFWGGSSQRFGSPRGGVSTQGQVLKYFRDMELRIAPSGYISTRGGIGSFFDFWLHIAIFCPNLASCLLDLPLLFQSFVADDIPGDFLHLVLHLFETAFNLVFAHLIPTHT